MKKVLLSLFTAIVCLPMAMAQIDAGHTVVTIQKSACGSYTWDKNGMTYTTDTSAAVTIGDTIYVLDFTIDTVPVKYDTTHVVNLNGECGVKWRDTLFTTYGTIDKTFHLSNGCDSVFRLNITLTDTTGSGQSFDTLTVNACEVYITPWGDTIDFSCDTTHVGNDSVSFCTASTTVHLTINHNYLTLTDTADVAAGCHYTFNGYGCDSVAAIRITSYTGTQRDTTVAQACGRYSWNVTDSYYRSTGVYSDTTVNEDSTCTIINTLDLTIADAYDTIHANKCAQHSQTFRARNGLSSQSYTFTVTESGTYSTDTSYTDTLFPDANLYSLDNLTGCITHHTLIATIMKPEQHVREVLDTFACNSYRFRVGTQSITLTDDADTTLVYQRHNAATPEQCYDEYGRIIFHIHRTTYNDTTVATCGSYTWPLNGETYTRSATITDTVKAQITYVSHTTYIIDTTSGDTIDIVYEYGTRDSIVYNEQGCDSLGRLRLTINPSPEMTIEGDWMLEPGQQTTLKAVCANLHSGLRYQWYKDGVSAGTADSIVVEAPGTMSENSNVEIRLVTTTNKNCTAENWLTVTSNDMGIEGIENVDVNIYPNPAIRIVNLSSDKMLSEVVIYNAIGQVVVSQNIDGNQTQLDLGNLASGNYTMRIVAANGEQATRKLIVSK